ncbi:hypothetical protein EGN72_03210 [Pseudorhodobacter sp. E13]|nr:hypothetical protein EGN72_03210 [Pseudorhodobacter sp. E13]
MSFGGRKFRVVKDSFDGGGQGKVYHAEDEITGLPAIYKVLDRPDDKNANGKARLRYMVDNQIGASLPQVCPPLVPREKRGELGYLTLRAPGVALDQDRPRRFPERLETAWILACHWSRLEAQGLAHGDVAPSNFTITPEGDVWVIDTDGFAAQDPFVPQPTMVGQHPFLAPEIRTARNQKKPIAATINSDRFAWTVLLSCVLLNRHPTDGLKVATPAKFDKVMMSGKWPERRRRPKKGETPITALGNDLPLLFDKAFNATPAGRPSANDWRLALGRALQNMVQHKCGHVFVAGKRNTCPWCGQSYQPLLSAKAQDQLTIRLRALSKPEATEFTFKRGERLILGRSNIPGASAFVSSEHLALAIIGNDLHLENLGRNGTLIAVKGRGEQLLSRLVTALPGKALDGAVLTLADTKVALGISAR